MLQKYEKIGCFFCLLTFELLDSIGFIDLKVLKTQISLENALGNIQNRHKKIGFVPTMGALHLGHIELVKRSISENDVTVVSIYVNPTQFNNSEDLEKYPVDIDSDLEMLSKVNCDFVFTPSFEIMYPQGRSVLKLDLLDLDKVLEGEFRNGHFEGVVAVVDRFFELIQPDKAYFGEKDFQQYLIVRELAARLYPQIVVVPCEIVRNVEGLALSSRNVRLSIEKQKLALCLYKALMMVKSQSIIEATELEELGKQFLKKQKGVNLEYFKIVDAFTLKPSRANDSIGLRAFVAAEIDGVRLIDNMELK